MISLLLASVLLLPGLLGLLMIWHVARPQRSPADTSNRLNKLRLIWYALTREHELARVIGWLQLDESKIAPIPSRPPPQAQKEASA